MPLKSLGSLPVPIKENKSSNNQSFTQPTFGILKNATPWISSIGIAKKVIQFLLLEFLNKSIVPQS